MNFMTDNRTIFDFNTVIERRNTASLKWDKYKGRDILPLWVADMDFKSPPAVLKALQGRVEHGVFGYALTPQALIDIAVSMLFEQYGWRIHPDWLVWLPGLVTGLNVTCRAIGNPGDDVVTAIPVYPPFLSAPLHFQRKVVMSPLEYHNGKWAFNFDALEKAITPKTRLFMLCNPHNPVGRVFTRDELVRIAAICEKHDLIVCSDEIHCGMILDVDKCHIPFAGLGKDIQDRTITLMAPSKTYNIAGLGCSFAVISNADIRRRFVQAMAGIVPRVNVLANTAALAAYQDTSTWLKQLLDCLRDNRDRVFSAVSKMKGFSICHTEATYLSWIDARESGLEDPAGFFENAGVGLSDGAEFGSPGFLRLNFGCPRATLDEALRRMQTAFMS
jgi:cysteine-S-conjugate beta-lyase